MLERSHENPETPEEAAAWKKADESPFAWGAGDHIDIASTSGLADSLPSYSNPTPEEIATAPDDTSLGWLANSNAYEYKGVEAFSKFSPGQLRAAAKDAAAVDYDTDRDEIKVASRGTLTNEEWGGWERVTFVPREPGEDGRAYLISPDGVAWRDPWGPIKREE
jgi:hypothetical protein